MSDAIAVTIWNEYRHERDNPDVAAIYPKGIHGALADSLGSHGLAVRTATLDEPEHGLTEAVLLWWGHRAHGDVDDGIVDRVQARVIDGMGLVVLHSGHHAKIFRRLMGTTCNLVWREADGGERERVWTVNPAHPICAGVPAHFELAKTEMYGEPFDIPEPDELVFLNWYQGGEVFRGGCCFRRGRGRIFYFSPGHETFPIYHDPTVIRVIANAARWARAPHRDGEPLAVVNRPIPPEKDAPAQKRR